MANPTVTRELILEAAERRAAQKAKNAKVEGAREHLLDFIEHTKPSYRAGWFHKRVCEVLERFLDDAIAGKRPRLIISAPPQHGKAMTLDTPVPTPRGWTKLGDLRPRDRVFAGDGSITRVRAVSPIWRNRPVFKVTTDTGSSVIADAQHEWVVRLDRKKKAETIRTTEYLAARHETMKDFRAPRVRVQGCLRTAKVRLPIAPYTLGIWLGDGRSTCGFITAGDEDRNFILTRIQDEGFTVRPHADPMNTGILGLHVKLRKAGLFEEKHIPAKYLRASREQRLALLQGLIDSDGYVAPDGQVEFCSTRERLAEGVHELVSSLGVKATIIPGRAVVNGKDCGPKYRVMFYFAEAASLPRKRSRCRSAEKKPDHYITVEPAGIADTVCIEVEHPSHTFLVGPAMIPTHNSEIMSRRFPVWAMGKYPHLRFICASYAATWADALSGDRQRIMVQPEYQEVFPELKLTKQRAEEVQNSEGGFLLAAGVDCGITGRSSDIGIIDDPIKGYKEATSELTKEAIWNWYRTDFYTRLQSGAGVIVMQTRWAEDDLVGRLLDEAKNGGEEWQVFNFPAIAEEDEEFRQKGEPLSPERFDAEDLASMKRVQGSYAWSALYQGHPAPAEGLMLKRDHWRYWTAPLPKFELIVVSLDAAFKNTEDSDHVSLQVWGFVGSRGYCLDRICERMGYTATKATALQLALKHKAHVLLVEDKANGSAVIEELSRTIGGKVSVIAVQAAGGKLARAWPFSADLEAGNALLPEGVAWAGEIVEYAAKFPTSPMDHDVDCVTQVFNWRRENMHGLFAYYQKESDKLLEHSKRQEDLMRPLQKIEVAEETPHCPECASVSVRQTQRGPDGERYYRCNQCAHNWANEVAQKAPAGFWSRREAIAQGYVM